MTPRRSWSSSIDSNSALKLPSPKPSLPLRWMSSKKIGPIDVRGEDLQQQALPFVGAPSIRMRRLRSSSTSSPWPGEALVDAFEIGVGRVLERDAARAQRVDASRRCRRCRARCAGCPRPCSRCRYSSIWRLVVLRLIERDADLAARARHRLGEEAGLLAFDVEVADLAEVEELLVVVRPLRHVAAMHVVREVIDRCRPRRSASPRAGDRDEVDVVDRRSAP